MDQTIIIILVIVICICFSISIGGGIGIFFANKPKPTTTTSAPLTPKIVIYFPNKQLKLDYTMTLPDGTIRNYKNLTLSGYKPEDSIFEIKEVGLFSGTFNII